MDFEFREEQLTLQTSAAEVLAKECPPSYLRGVIDGDADAGDLWRTLVALDWPGLAISEEHGGVGLSAVELAIVLEQLGYVSDPTPFVATTSQFVPVVAACGDPEQQARFLGAVASGACTGTLALAGDDGRWDLRAPAVEAVRSGDAWSLRGTAAYVVDGDRADELAVVARTGDGPQVFVVPAGAVAAERTPSFDETLHVARVTFDGATVGDDRRLAGDGGAPDPTMTDPSTTDGGAPAGSMHRSSTAAGAPAGSTHRSSTTADAPAGTSDPSTTDGGAPAGSTHRSSTAAGAPAGTSDPSTTAGGAPDGGTTAGSSSTSTSTSTRIEQAIEQAVTGLAMTMVGACQRILDLAVEYVSGREQFGMPVGSFQAVKHKAVDVHLAIERARAVGYFAALTIAEDDPRRALAASMAKAAAGDAQRIAFQHGVQLFGGIGFTWENDLHLYIRRAKAGELLFGGAAEHRQRVGRLVMDDRPRPTEG